MIKEMLNKVYEFCETGSNVVLREIEDYCRENNLFFAEDEDFIQIEDDKFSLNF